ncbi:MAG: PAS domain S-box protein [Rhodocyclales bacterium]|nr:PAS domain S-box protein [Rhodocyclales bacterium]
MSNETSSRNGISPQQQIALLVFENLAEGVIFTDAGGTILTVNAGFTRITGYTADEVIGRNPRLLQSGVQERDFYEEMWRTLKTAGRWRGEIINRRKSGELYPELLSISAVRDAEGGITNYIGVFSDLSERLAQERAVREMRERLDLALDAGGVGTWIWEPGSGRLECDERACELIAGSQNDPPRTFEALLERIPAYERPRVMDAFMRPTRQQLTFRVEFRVVLPDGADRHLVARARPHCGEADGVCRVFGVIWDVTERYLREREIRELNATLELRVEERTADLQAAVAELESFSYSVAHDLRAPLRGLDGFSKILIDDYGDRLDEDGRQHLRRIRAASQRLDRLIENLLKLSRISQSRMERVPVNLSGMAREVAIVLQEEQPQRGAEFVIERRLRAVGDPVLLRALLENLLGNAWKYSSRKERARIEFGAKRIGEEETAFFVRDNGDGFDMALAGKLFAPFQRLHGTDEFAGTGVGLASVARTVSRHGGRVWAEAAKGEGATFFFTLPDHG